jgi:hypothetical protein
MDANFHSPSRHGPDQTVFLSYSRRDYYFAESLAVQLLDRDIPAWLDVMNLKPGAEWEQGLREALESAPCFVLIASPNAMKSPNVQAEWRQAIERGKRILIALFLATPLPAELRGFEVVDFRGGFHRGLNEFVARLAAIENRTPLAHPETVRVSRIPRCPAWIFAMFGGLAVPMIAFLALILARGDMPVNPLAGLGTAAIWLGGMATAMTFFWYFCVAFLRRRMGMTRLMFCLIALAAIYINPLILLFRHGPAGLGDFTPGLQPLIVHHWRVGAILAAIPLAALAVLVWARPVALLHWSPTGKAWNWYREHHVARSSHVWVDAATKFSTIRWFRLVYDAADAPAAERLREQLLEAGAREMPAQPPVTGGNAPEAATTAVLLLTNRTRILWLNQQAVNEKGTVFTVVASAIGLPDSLSWLWKREWIDFRHWDPQQSKSVHRSPRLPEAVTTVRLPRHIAWAHHLVCALGTLFFVASSLTISDESSFVLTPLSAFLLMGSILGWAFVLPARGLVRRKTTFTRFERWTGWVACFGVLVSLVGLYEMVIQGGSWIRALPAALFLVAAPVLLWRLRPQIAFWFPHPDAPDETRNSCLSPSPDWHTFLVGMLYLSVWMVVLKDLNK